MPPTDNNEAAAPDNILGQRMRQRMEQIKVDIKYVADHSEVKESALYNILAGRTTNPTTKVLFSIARALKVSVLWLEGASDIVPLGTLKVRGMAERNAWRPLPTNTPDAREVDDVPPWDPKLRDRPRFAVRVIDDHLAGLSPALLPGSDALVLDLTSGDMEIRDNGIYLIHRDRSGIYERAFWRARVLPNRTIEFAALSRDDSDDEKFVMTCDEIKQRQNPVVSALLYGQCVNYL